MKKKYDLKKMKQVESPYKKNIGKDKEIKVHVSLRLDSEIIAWLKDQAEKEGLGYQTYLNMFLKKNMSSPAGDANLLKKIDERLKKIEKAVFEKKGA